MKKSLKQMQKDFEASLELSQFRSRNLKRNKQGGVKAVQTRNINKLFKDSVK